MTTTHYAVKLLIDFTVVAILIAGIWQFRTPRSARFGNLTAACALLVALLLVLYRNGVIAPGVVMLSLLIGSALGYAVARAVSMIQIPAMVAFQHGAGGIAASLVSFVELMGGSQSLEMINEMSGILGLTIGSLTFSGSIVAGAKLSNRIRQTPRILPAHNSLMLMNLAAILLTGLAVPYVSSDAGLGLLLALTALSIAFGILFSIRIGGADMPVLISFLNATAGLAAAFCGMVIENQLLIAFGATVAASGSILTHVMCKAMNRRLSGIFAPLAETVDTPPEDLPECSPSEAIRKTDKEKDLATAGNIISAAKTVIIVPGYGMARAQAQFEIVALAKKMVDLGKDVKYAIHPVAGRMPGHMNVLLAEAGVDYDMLIEMDTVNPEFKSTDLVLVVGACDVVNPAAINVEGTPISGMPILMAHEAKQLIICNYDKKPGYSGVENPLYDNAKTLLMPGDAKQTASELIESFSVLSN